MSEINDTRWKPSAEQTAILNGLLEEQAKEKSQADFVRRWLPFGGSAWTQIVGVLEPPRLNDQGDLVLSYFDRLSPAGREATFEKLAGVLERIPMERSLALRLREVTVLRTSKVRALEQALRECAEKPGPERLVLMLAPTGGGKTMCCNYLAERLNARIVEVRDVWRHSATGFVPLQDICRAVGVRVGRGVTMAAMQDALVRYCLERRIVLAFDEGEHFGRSSLNLVKFLLNKTRIVVALFCVPNEYERWEDYWPNEAPQIARRCHACIELSVVDPEDAGLFFPAGQFADKASELNYLATEASRFGHFSLVKRVADKLEGVSKAGHDDVQKAVGQALRQMRRERRTA